MIASLLKSHNVMPDYDMAKKFYKWVEQLPEPTKLVEHLGGNGQINPCCQLATFQLQKLAEAADARNEVPGVLKSAGTYFKWGQKRPIYLCEAVQNHLDLDYGPMSFIIMQQLSYCKEVIHGSITPIPVSILTMSREDDQKIWRDTFQESCNDWLFGPVYYHQCIGFLSNSGSLSIWNYDHWLTLGSSSLKTETNILAWRFGSDHSMTFDGLQIPKGLGNQWLVIKTFQDLNFLSGQQQKGIRVIPKDPNVVTGIPTVFVSGTTMNGENPCPGIGTARSLRLAFGNAIRVIAVENSGDSAGLHDPVFDDIIVLSTPLKKSARDHLESVQNLLEVHANSLYLSTEEIEVRILSEQLDQCDFSSRILIPRKVALRQVTKPFMTIHEKYFPQFKIPPFIEQENGEPDEEFVARAQPFLNSCSFPVLVKSLYFGAIVTQDLAEIKSAIKRLRTHWDKAIYIQEAKCGFEETIMFSAYKGELLEGEKGAVHMRKAMITQQGKAWAATLSTELPEDFTKQLTGAVAELNWTGGGEIEYVRTLDDQKYLIDWNLRFPGWVYGASQETVNLPAALIATAFKETLNIELLFEQPKLHPGQATGFVRTVTEIPWSKKISPIIMRGPEFLASNIFSETAGPLAMARCMQHPSRQAQMARLLQKYLEEDLQESATNGHAGNISGKYGDILPTPEDTFKIPSTPCRYLSTSALHQTLSQFKGIVERAARKGSNGKLEILVALSIKTQPDPAILKEALECGYVADAIALPELHLALKHGFKTEQMIMNGPCKFWRRKWEGAKSQDGTQNGLAGEILKKQQFLAVFADSVTELENFSSDVINHGGIIGIRLAMPGTGTRFGLDISDPEAINRLMKALNALPEGVNIGFHFHYASSDLGLNTWFNMCRIFLSSCHSIMAMSGCKHPLTTLDFGGGFVPITKELQPQFENGLTELFALVASDFPQVKRVILEPGKCVTVTTTTVIMRVLEIREPVLFQNHPGQTPGKIPMRAVVVDACLGDVRLAQSRFHSQLPGSSQYHRRAYSLSAMNGADWKLIPRDGLDVVLGRLCMEIDMLVTGAVLPADLKIGDYLALTHAGAYEASAAYPFGEGYYYGPIVVEGHTE